MYHFVVFCLPGVPYLGKQPRFNCRDFSYEKAFTYVDVESINIDEMMETVKTIGPVYSKFIILEKENCVIVPMNSEYDYEESEGDDDDDDDDEGDKLRIAIRSGDTFFCEYEDLDSTLVRMGILGWGIVELLDHNYISLLL